MALKRSVATFLASGWPPTGRALRFAGVVAGAYLALSLLWILASDRAVALLAEDLVEVSGFQTVKGAGFVVATAALLFVTLAFYGAREERMRAGLAEAHQRTEALINALPASAALLDRDGRILLVNDAWQRFALSEGTAPVTSLEVGGNYLAVCDRAAASGSDPADRIAQGLRAVLVGQRDRFELDYSNRGSGNHDQRWFRIRVAPIEGGGGAVVMQVDITDQRRAESQRRLWAAALASTTEGVFITDGEGRIVTVNQGFTGITREPAETVTGRPVWEVSVVSHNGEFQQVVRGVLASGIPWEGELWGRRRDGEVYPCLVSLTRVVGPDGHDPHLVGIFNDISPLKHYEERLAFMAHHDPLTGLANRLLFEEEVASGLKRAARRDRRLAVVFIDLDGFKAINDSLGHAIGDQFLRALSERLSGAVRDADVVARLAGDEFAVLVDDVKTDADVTKVCEKVLTSLRHPVHLEGYDLSAAGSVGVATYPQDGTDVTTLLRNADAAMYEAKSQGGDRIQNFHQALHERARETFVISNDLRHALVRDQFSLVYQPQVNLSTGAIVGAEALLRWDHPTEGAVDPSEFIPYLERLNLIGEVGEWALRRAAAAAVEWPEGPDGPLTVAVNVSALQLRARALPQVITETLASTGLVPERLVVEVTESAIMRNPDAAARMLQALHEIGIRVAVDDFGTGYSSLANIKQFQVDALKIDRSFVAGTPEGADDAPIVCAIVSMAHSLRMVPIAEGVESEAQRLFLAELGCRVGQGFLFSPPLTADALQDFARQPGCVSGQWQRG